MKDVVITQEQFEKILKQIRNTDKTPDYEYSGNVNYLNNKGIPPSAGARWCTPKELCESYLHDIKIGRLEKSLKELMGTSAR